MTTLEQDRQQKRPEIGVVPKEPGRAEEDVVVAEQCGVIEAGEDFAVDAVAATSPQRPYYTGGVSYAGEIPERAVSQTAKMTGFNNRPA